MSGEDPVAPAPGRRPADPSLADQLELPMAHPETEVRHLRSTRESRAARDARSARDAAKVLPRAAGPSSVRERIQPSRNAPGAHPVTGTPDPGSASGVPRSGGVRAADGRPPELAAFRAGLGLAAAAFAAPVIVPAVVDRAAADRQLVVGAVALILLSRLVDGPTVWVIGLLLATGVLVGAGFSRASVAASVEAGGAPGFRGRWESVVSGAAGIESGIVPAVLAFSLVLAIRLVPFNWLLLAAAAVSYVLLDRTIALERVLALSPEHGAERWKAVLAVVASAFLGSAGIASMIDGGLAGVGPPALQESDLVFLAAGDAVVATLLGFRLARLGPATRREAVVSGLGFGAVAAIGAGLLRAMAIPQLLGPALLTLLVYLWDALNATTPSIRRDPRWRWQVGLLLVLSAVVIGWNLRLRA